MRRRWRLAGTVIGHHATKRSWSHLRPGRAPAHEADRRHIHVVCPQHATPQAAALALRNRACAQRRSQPVAFDQARYVHGQCLSRASGHRRRPRRWRLRRDGADQRWFVHGSIPFHVASSITLFVAIHALAIHSSTPKNITRSCSTTARAGSLAAPTSAD